MIEIVSEALLWLGGILVLIGTVGILRFPDFYTRTHAATVATVGGFTLSLLGIAVLNPFGIYFIKILIVLVVSLIANPTATHALADSAYKIGVKPAKLARDDLASTKPRLRGGTGAGTRKRAGTDPGHRTRLSRTRGKA